MDPAWFEQVLYPFQDEVLAVAERVETGFYLTGGTALGRVHLRHRYSEDLGLFVNDDDRFPAWTDRPKDLADVWGLCLRGGLAMKDALVGASSKSVGVFAADVARVLLGATADDGDSCAGFRRRHRRRSSSATCGRSGKTSCSSAETSPAPAARFKRPVQNWNCRRVWKNCVVPTTPNRLSWPTP